MPAPNRQQALLSAARASASFDVEKLTAVIFGSYELAREHAEMRSRAEEALGETDGRVLPRVYRGLSRSELYEEGLKAAKVLMASTAAHGFRHFNEFTFTYSLISTSPFGHQFALFMPALRLYGTDAQIAQWLPLVTGLKIIGTFVQTEIGHGSFIRGFETTATFDRATDEIVVHSPTASSTKYWPGGAGFSSSHAIVTAKLVVDGKDHGPHPFLVQLRDLETYAPMPGVELGDIGMKLGWNGADNGWLRFDQVRIPRAHMLQRNTTLSRDGVVTHSPVDKLNYGAMSGGRTYIVHSSAFSIAKAATIVTRYSFVREQGFVDAESDAREVALIAFSAQRRRVLLVIAQAYAVRFAAFALYELYDRHVALLRRGDASLLKEMHTTTACIKAFATDTAAAAVDDARRMCGGHGVVALSGLPALLGDVLPNVTIEGENHVMLMQTARHLVRAAAQLRKGARADSLEPALRYLADDYGAENDGDVEDAATQLRAFRRRAARLVFDAETLVRESTASGASLARAQDTHSPALADAARAHAAQWTLAAFSAGVARAPDARVRNVLRALCDVYALHALAAQGVRGASALFATRVDALVPDAVALVDAWNFSDASLQSAIGQYDGNAYETLLSWTRQLPINQAARANGGRGPGVEEHILPTLRSKL